MRVIVIGGGAVGLCAAEALSARDCEVAVVEADRCGAGASAGNAGWITPSLATPVPGPGVIAASLRWLIDPSGPLWIRPTLSPDLLRWIADFMLSCRRPAYERGLVAMQHLVGRASDAFDALAARGVEFEEHDDPLLYPSFEPAELEHVWHVVEEIRRAGSSQRFERLSREDMRALEPALGPDLVGGVIAHGEQRVRPELLTAGVHRALIARGVDVLEGVPVARLARNGGGWTVTSSSGMGQKADAVVIAAGVDSARLLAAHGVRLPIAAAKGYSRTYPLDPPDRGARSTWRVPRSRSASSTAVCACPGRSSSAPVACLCRPAGCRRSLRPLNGRCRAGGCRPNRSTGPACARCRRTALRSSGRYRGSTACIWPQPTPRSASPSRR